MENIFSFKDNQYVDSGVTHVREVVRAILIDENNNICLEYILDKDGFGYRDYFETPGGGAKENESHEKTLKREIAEEVGFDCDIIEFLGQVNDFYNLIKRENHNYYYLAKIKGNVEQHLEEDEIKRISKIIFISIDEAIKLYENMQNCGVGYLVKQRELPILYLARKSLQSKI